MNYRKQCVIVTIVVPTWVGSIMWALFSLIRDGVAVVLVFVWGFSVVISFVRLVPIFLSLEGIAKRACDETVKFVVSGTLSYVLG